MSLFLPFFYFKVSDVGGLKIMGTISIRTFRGRIKGYSTSRIRGIANDKFSAVNARKASKQILKSRKK